VQGGHHNAHEQAHLHAKKHAHEEAQQPGGKVALRVAPQSHRQLEVQQREYRAYQDGRQRRFRDVVKVRTQVAQGQQHDDAYTGRNKSEKPVGSIFKLNKNKIKKLEGINMFGYYRIKG